MPVAINGEITVVTEQPRKTSAFSSGFFGCFGVMAAILLVMLLVNAILFGGCTALSIVGCLGTAVRMTVEQDAARQAANQKSAPKKVQRDVPPNAFRVLAAEFKRDDHGKPIVSVWVENGTSRTITRVHFHGTLRAAGRVWVDAYFQYDVPGGLKPEEAAGWQIEPKNQAAWSGAPDDISGATLKVSVTRIDGTDGKPIWKEIKSEDKL